jgi:hypothetical protein
MNILQNENNFEQNIMISEGKMKNELLSLSLDENIYEWSFIKRFDYKERDQIIENSQLTQIKTVKDAFNFIIKFDFSNLKLNKKEKQLMKDKNIEEQENIKRKIKNSIFTSFLIDALKRKYGNANFLGNKMIIDINENLSYKSKIFNVYNVANINASIKENNQATINVSFSINIDFCCDIFLKEYINNFQTYLNLKNKSLPGIFTTSKGKECKIRIKSIIPLNKITNKERNELKKYEHMITDDLPQETLFARVEFYNNNYNFIVSLDTLKLSVGAGLITMHNEYNKTEENILHLDIKNILNEYSELRNEIIDVSKSFSLRTNKLEYFIKEKFDNMICFNNVKAEIHPANHYNMDRRLNKKPIIDIIAIIDPHSKNCDFYRNKIYNLKPYTEANVKVNIHFIEFPLFMYNQEPDSFKEINEKKYLFMFKQFKDYLITKIENMKFEHNMKNPVAWIFWPRRFNPNSRNVFEEYYEEFDYDMENTLLKINYKSPETYKHNTYHLPKRFLEYDLLSIIPIQNTWESYNDDDFKNANFQGSDMKFRNIIESIIIQSETLNDQLEYLKENNILTVDMIYSLDINRNMKEFSRQELACHCCQFLPVINNTILDQYKDVAISMAKIYEGKGEERSKEEIEDFYISILNKLDNYNIKIRNKYFLRDGILYENQNDIKEILQDNTIIIQVKKSNIASYIDPNKYMNNYSHYHNTFMYEQKDGKKRLPNRYLLYVNNKSYPELSENDFIFGASCKVMVYKQNNDHDDDKHCRSLHVANIIKNNTTLNTNHIMKTIGNTCLSNTTTAEGFCMLPYAQKMADRIPYYFIKDGNLESRLSRYVEMDGETNPKQKILNSFNEMLTIFGSNMWT